MVCRHILLLSLSALGLAACEEVATYQAEREIAGTDYQATWTTYRKTTVELVYPADRAQSDEAVLAVAATLTGCETTSIEQLRKEGDSAIITVAARCEGAPPTSDITYIVQAATFESQRNAQGAQARFAQADLPSYITRVREGGRNYYRVIVGPLTSRQDALDVRRLARRTGFGDAFIISSGNSKG